MLPEVQVNTGMSKASRSLDELSCKVIVSMLLPVLIRLETILRRLRFNSPMRVTFARYSSRDVKPFYPLLCTATQSLCNYHLPFQRSTILSEVYKSNKVMIAMFPGTRSMNIRNMNASIIRTLHRR